MNEQLYRKVSKPYIGCEDCQQHGCPTCYEYEKVGPEHQHQFMPWLTLPNGSSWLGCASCDWQYQYDHG